MKKLLITAAAATLLTTGAFAQSIMGKPFEWGVKAGLNVTGLTDSDFSEAGRHADAKMKASFYMGVFAEFNVVDDILSIQPELIYSRQGNRYKEGDYKMWNRMNYLNLPVLAKLHVWNRLTIDTGPQFGLLMNAKSKIESPGHDGTHSTTSKCKKFDVSWAIGASYRINNNFDVSARYNLGLTKTVKHESDHKNSVIQIGAGYRF